MTQVPYLIQLEICLAACALGEPAAFYLFNPKTGQFHFSYTANRLNNRFGVLGLKPWQRSYHLPAVFAESFLHEIDRPTRYALHYFMHNYSANYRNALKHDVFSVQEPPTGYQQFIKNHTTKTSLLMQDGDDKLINRLAPY